ncbi:hypothetical protein DFQ26_000324, partial [Actinomortierella ambigua]
MVLGLDFIHHKGIVHRDLKSTNVLLTHHMEVKLCDVGSPTIKATARSRCKGNPALNGSLRWMAPELLMNGPQYTTKSDMYALGMVMWEMAANCTRPFQDLLDCSAVVATILRGKREVLPNDTPNDYHQWVLRCWEQDPDKRPEIGDMIATNDSEPQLEDVWLSASGSSSSEATLTSSSPSSASSTDVRGENDIEALVTLAATYENGTGVAKDDKEAFNIYYRAAVLGSVEAQYKTGTYLYGGGGTQKNHGAAEHWMR